jgi:hypothetical protein
MDAKKYLEFEAKFKNLGGTETGAWEEPLREKFRG